VRSSRLRTLPVGPVGKSPSATNTAARGSQPGGFELPVGRVEQLLSVAQRAVGLQPHDGNGQLAVACGPGHTDHRAVLDQLGAVGDQHLLQGQAVHGTGSFQ
jgi:hypothetical protein